MSPQTLTQRVDSLEKRMTALEQLPARLDDLTLQFSQFRTEVHGEFSAVRVEMRELGDTLRGDARAR
jgi:hypothetical protein